MKDSSVNLNDVIKTVLTSSFFDKITASSWIRLEKWLEKRHVRITTIGSDIKRNTEEFSKPNMVLNLCHYDALRLVLRCDRLLFSNGLSVSSSSPTYRIYNTGNGERPYLSIT